MTTYEESFFLDELASHSADSKKFIACGYFRTLVSGRHKIKVLVDAFNARGYFLALTSDSLLVVTTPAPGTSRPILERLTMFTVPLSTVSNVSLSSKCLLIESRDHELALEMRLSNKYFPQQDALIDAIAVKFRQVETVASIRAARTKWLWIRIALAAAAVGYMFYRC